MTTRHFGQHTIETSSEDKVFFPKSGITKGDLIDYYQKIGDTILTHMRDRPVTMHRYPDGIDAEGFYQKQTPDYFPDFIPRRTLRKEGGSVDHCICNRTAALVYLADQGCITPHVWLSRKDKPTQPDRLVIDLDPSDNDFEKVRFAARRCCEALEDRGLAVFLQLTGSRGIHVVSPIRRGPNFDEVRDATRQIAADLADRHHDTLTVEQYKKDRGDRVYLDVARNAYAQTMVTPYTVRARDNAPVATPIDRDELDRPDLRPDRYTIRNIFRRLAQRDDPWSSISSSARRLNTSAP